MLDMSVKLAGVTLKNPVVVASGTFGFGREYSQFYDLGELGGICAKGLTLHPRNGNPAPRIAETPMGILNSVGLENPGVDAFIKEELPFLRGEGLPYKKRFETKIIANISGNTPEEYGVMCEKLAEAGVDMIEVNISCPNVKAGGLAYGTRPELAVEVTEEAKKHASVPVMVKLSPNVTDITEIARAAEEYRAASRSCETELAEKNNLLYQTIIEDRTAAYIVDKAEELGILCQAEVTCSNDENGVPCPWEVTARGVWTEEKRAAVGRLLEGDLGIPPQRQYFEEELP